MASASSLHDCGDVGRCFLTARIPNLFHSGSIRWALVRHNDRVAIPLHGFSHEFQCRSLVSGFRDKGLKNFAFMVDGAPEIVSLAHGSSRRLRPDATAIAAIVSFFQIDVCGSHAQSKCRNGPPSDGRFRDRYRSLARGAGLRHCAVTAEIEYTSSPQAG
jgi:hypothetical protein